MSESTLNPFARNFKGTPTVLDIHGRAIAIGDELLIHSPQAPFFRVLSIAPVVDPNAPPNVLAVDLACRWRFHVGRNVPVVEFVRTRVAADLPGAKQLAEEQVEEPQEESLMQMRESPDA